MKSEYFKLLGYGIAKGTKLPKHNNESFSRHIWYSDTKNLKKYKTLWFSIHGDDMTFYMYQDAETNKKDIEGILEKCKEYYTEDQLNDIVTGYITYLNELIEKIKNGECSVMDY